MSVEQGFDSYEGPQTDLNNVEPDVCYEGPDIYKKRLLGVTEYYTGDPHAFLTKEEEAELATHIQAGLAIAEEKRRIEEAIDAKDQIDPKLTEEYLAVARIYNKGRQAEHKLVETHLRYGAMKARQSMGLYSNRDMRDEEPQSKRYKKTKPSKLRGRFMDSVADLSSATADLDRRIQAASIGLIKAARNFQPSKGARFATYAAWYIEDEIVRGLHEETTGAYVPPQRSAEIAALRKLDPNDPDTQVKTEKLEPYKDRHRATFLEDLPLPKGTDEEGTTEIDEILTTNANPTEAEAIRNIAREMLDETLDTLSEREATVIRMRFGLIEDDEQIYTRDEIGEVLGVTRERIRQIEVKTMSKLRHPSRSQRLKGLLPFGDEGVPHMAGEELKLTRTIARLGRRAITIPPAIETWQADQDDTWETPIWHTRPEHGTPEYQQVYNQFRQQMLETPLYTLQKSFEEAMRSPYPKEWVDRIESTLGMQLTPEHIEDFWNTTLESFIKVAERKLQGDLSHNRVGQLFSALLMNRMRGTDTITLRIPTGSEGKIGFIGAWQHSGHIIIEGDAGDYVGHGMQQTSKITVKGSVGDYAGAQAKDYASLEIEGNCGNYAGYKSSGNSSVIIEGEAGKESGKNERGSAEVTILNNYA